MPKVTHGWLLPHSAGLTDRGWAEGLRAAAFSHHKAHIEDFWGKRKQSGAARWSACVRLGRFTATFIKSSPSLQLT